jgi:hypothetical protein
VIPVLLTVLTLLALLALTVRILLLLARLLATALLLLAGFLAGILILLVLVRHGRSPLLDVTHVTTQAARHWFRKK